MHSHFCCKSAAVVPGGSISSGDGGSSGSTSIGSSNLLLA